jgi:hypothetical protein
LVSRPLLANSSSQSCSQIHGYPCLRSSPAQPLATQLCGLGPECRPSLIPSPSPGASSWGGTRLPPMGPPPGLGSWQPAGGSLSMLHLFIDRALPQLLFQSPASCRRLIREGGAGSWPRAVTQYWEGTQRACLLARLSFLSPECSAIYPRSWDLRTCSGRCSVEEGRPVASGPPRWAVLPPGAPRPDEVPPYLVCPSGSGLRESQSSRPA